jgi:salicylate 5-hydroxylase large subunit
VDEHTPHMVTETLIRGMYQYWREVMEAPEGPATASAAAPDCGHGAA